MTAYEVIWLDPVLEKLAAVWVESPDRTLVTSAAEAIDFVPSHEPREFGVWLRGTTYVIFAEPIVVIFDIIEDDHHVRILDLWRR
jgi:hypothetical protein